MFIDIEKVNSKNISFINFEKLERTDSLGFYRLLTDNTPTKEHIHYDVGSTFREDIIEAGFKVEKEKSIPLIFEDVKLDCGYRIDLLVEDKLVLELKSVEELSDLHFAQTLTYLRLGNFKLGLLLNFN